MRIVAVTKTHGADAVRAALAAGIRDIAEALGVSIGTVDRALHNRPRISAKTRQKVLRHAAALLRQHVQQHRAARIPGEDLEQRHTFMI